jgi:predicted RNase H-like HicB family nuclease
MPTANDTSAETITIPLAVTLTVIAVRDPSGGYSIAVPALPGCVSEADEADEIAKNIREAAEGWLVAMHKKNLPEVLADFSGHDL